MPKPAGERYKVMIMRGPARRARLRLLRLGRLLLGRNKLRRSCDRIEGAVIVLLLAAFVTASVLAASFAGHIYRSEHAAVARLRPAVAVLSRPGAAGSQTTAAAATWLLPDGAERSGMLTSVTAPAIYDAPAESSVKIRLDHSGQPVAPPPSWYDIIATALLASVVTIAGAATVLILCYVLCREALDRYRAARWDSAWAAVGPQWTSRR
jgi:hypothetical protein